MKLSDTGNRLLLILQSVLCVVLTALKGKEGQNSGAIVYMTLISAIAMLVGFLLTYILPRSIVKMGKEKL